jgi:ribulose-phosphate 3-epimerase
MKIRIAPSLLSADFARLADEVEDVARAGADLLHLDLMDGHFVPNLTFGPAIVQSLARRSSIALDAHLMVTNPDSLIADLVAAPVARISVHVEACHHLQRTLQSIRDAGAEAGVAINPATSLALLEESLDWIDFVLVMSVNPGFGGQAFLAQSLDKIRRLRAMLGDRSMDISVDGGVDHTNAGALVTAGATTLIAGSAVFGCDDRGAAIDRIRTAASDGGTR